MKTIAAVLFVVGLVGVTCAADPTGTWAYETKRKNEDGGVVVVKSALKLDLKDGKLTGTVTGGGFGGRGGGKGGGKGGADTKIEDGKYDKAKDEISFTTREFGDDKFVTKYSGRVEKDAMKLTMTPDFNGKEIRTEVEATREKEEKKKD